MEQNENQYEDIDRRKLAFLIGGILVIIVAILLAIYLFTDRTNASTGDGDAILITPERMDKISDEVSERVLDTLRTDILADMIGNSVSEELGKDKIYEILSQGDVEVIAIGDEQLREILAGMISELGISGDGVFTDDQKKYMKLAIDQAIQDALGNLSVSQPLTNEEKRQLEDRLKQELSELLRNQIQNSSFQLSDSDLAKIVKSPNLESLITSVANKITKQQLKQLQSNIIANVKKSIKTPIKGVDYFTDADIQSIQSKVLNSANKEMLKQIELLSSKIMEVKASVSALTKQVQELKKLDKEKTSDIEKLQNSITQIHASIQHINSVTNQLTDAITVTGNHLERVSGNGSEIQSEKVSSSNLTIAQFVDILAGNDRVYTGAIQELDKIIKQLKEENAKKDEAFDRSLKELENSLDDNGKALENTKAALEQSDKEIRSQMDQKSDELNKKLEEEKKTREDSDLDLQKQVDKTNELIGKPEEADKVEGDTVFQKIGSIVKILSKEGIEGLYQMLQKIGGAETVEEGMENLHTNLQDARARVGELEKEKWFSDITLLAQAQQEGVSGYTYQESGSAFVYQIPLTTQKDTIELAAEDTAIVVDFKQPGKLPSNVAFSVSGNDLLITFTNRPTRNINITTIHVYKEK